MALARSVQKFYQTVHSILTTLIDDGVRSVALTAEPSIAEIIERANKLHNSSAVQRTISLEPIPYAAFAVSHFTGSSTANIHPPRKAHRFLFQLATDLENQYRSCFVIDGGSMPDEVVDSLTRLKNHHIMAVCRHMQNQGYKLDFWPESDLDEIVEQMSMLSKFFCPIFGYAHAPFEYALRDILNGSFGRAGVAVSESV